MLKEFIEYLHELKEKPPVSVQIDGDHYKVHEDGTLGDPVRKPAPIAKPTLQVSTLTGFLDAYRAKLDSFPEHHAIHVENYKTVSLIALDADEHGRRHTWLRATCLEENPFRFNEYQNPETFIISLQSGFYVTDEIVKLQKLASSLTAENSVQASDDGLSQVVTVKQGTVTRATVELPPRLPLVPWRTFREVNPVMTEFLVRLKGKPGELPSIALLEVDGGKWKLDTVHAVGSYLRASLPKATVIA